MPVLTIVLLRHGSNLARPVIIHDIIHGLIYVPSTPCCGFLGVSSDGNCAYVHRGSFTSNSKSVRRAISEPYECIQHLAVPGGHPSNYEPGATLLNFSDRAQTVERTPYSISIHCTLMTLMVYLEISVQDVTALKKKLTLCVNSIKAWMTNAKLKLNPSKTEVLLIGTKQQQQKHFLSLFPNSNLAHNTSPASSAHNIGVTFDSELKFDHHIRQICKSCFYHFRDLRRIRRHLSIDTAKMIANSLITSRLDYCNSLLFNIDDKYMKQLQQVQNSLA